MLAGTANGTMGIVCDQCAPVEGWSRRRLLFAAPVAAGAASLAAVRGPSRAGAADQGLPRLRPATVRLTSGQSLEILPRRTWGADLPPTGVIQAEHDVRFLLVHHTVSNNTYGADAVVGMVRGFYHFHTGDLGWPDVAYNFLVDRFGRIWEARAHSLAGAVVGDAVGGNQGFDQKCAFIGDHTAQAPSADAQSAMVKLLAWLADRHGIATDPGAQATFTSRGSNRWAAGTSVTTATIEGHRAMSQTACPGDACLALVHNSFPARVTTWRGGTTPPPPSSTTTVAGGQEPTSGISTEPPSTTIDTTATTTTVATPGTDGPATAPDLDGDASGVIDARHRSSEGSRWPWLAAGTTGAVGLGALAVVIRRRATVAGAGPPARSDDDRDD